MRQHLILRPTDAFFWAGWAFALAAFITLAFWVDGSYDIARENAISDELWYHHHFFPLSDEYWQFFRATGVVPSVVAMVLLVSAALAIRGHVAGALIAVLALATGAVQLAVRAAVDRPVNPATLTDPARSYPAADSFPSGHAFGEMLALALVFWFVPRVVRWPAVVLAVRAVSIWIVVMGGLERVVDGNHWPTDIIGAHLLALLCVSPLLWLDAMLRRRSIATAEGYAPQISRPSSSTLRTSDSSPTTSV
jgi:membrane-associated phospholipid phosphatase